MATKKSNRRVEPVHWGAIFFATLGVIIITAVLYALLFRLLPTSYCANSISCINNLTGDFMANRQSTFMGHDVSLPESLASLATQPTVLGTTTAPKHIYVDLSSQQLTAYEGAARVMSFPISSGRWHPTPTGTFRIWVKLRYTHMEGGNKDDGTYYNLYNVPYTMFFYNDDVPKSAGFSLHGAYWHNNFGHPMSHGCVNIRPEDAARLYAWADPATTGNMTYASDRSQGTEVTIVGETPAE